MNFYDGLLVLQKQKPSNGHIVEPKSQVPVQQESAKPKSVAEPKKSKAQDKKNASVLLSPVDMFILKLLCMLMSI